MVFREDKVMSLSDMVSGSAGSVGEGVQVIGSGSIESMISSVASSTGVQDFASVTSAPNLWSEALVSLEFVALLLVVAYLAQVLLPKGTKASRERWGEYVPVRVAPSYRYGYSFVRSGTVNVRIG